MFPGSFALVFAAAASAAGPVAVFQIQDLTGALNEPTVDQLSAYLGTRVAEEGDISIVPSSQIKEALKARQIDSYKTCFDEACASAAAARSA